MKTVIKASPTEYGAHDVFQNGEKVATFWFLRDRREFGGRIEIVTTGQFTNLKTGLAMNLSNYAWFKDVRRDVPQFLENTKAI